MIDPNELADALELLVKLLRVPAEPAPMPETPAGLTQLQGQCLSMINELAPEWLPPSYVFAHIQIESNWNPMIHSADGLGSIGLMQVLPGTASEVGVPYDQSQPYNSILAGIRYIKKCRDYLASKGIDPGVYHPEPYNVGAAGYVKGRRNDKYRKLWADAQAKFSFVDKL